MGVIEARRRILLNQPHLIDASGNPITFQTDMVAKMGVKAHFSPVQEGTGDPSPSNIRPISGWTGCTVSHSGADTSNPTTYPVTFPAVGKNKLNINAPYQQPSDIYYTPTTKRIFKPNTYNVGSSSSNYFGANNVLRYEIANGTLTFKSQSGYGVGFAMNLAPGNYYLSYTLVSGSVQKYVAHYAQDGTYISGQGISNAFTVPENADITVVGFSTYLSTGDDESVTDIQVESGSTATAYEPFTNTIYGGYVDYERGEVVADIVKVSYNGSENGWSKNTGRDGFGIDLSDIADNSKLVISNRFIKRTSSSGTGVYITNAGDVLLVQKAFNIASTIDDWKTWLASNNLDVCYTLATPIHYPITPQIIKSFKGANTIWSDTNGNVSLKYWKH